MCVKVSCVTYSRPAMTLAQQHIDLQIGVYVKIDPVLLADGLDDAERAVVVLVRVVGRLGDIVVAEGLVRHLRWVLVDREVVQVGFQACLRRLRVRHVRPHRLVRPDLHLLH